jgi:hypothetical protein
VNDNPVQALHPLRSQVLAVDALSSTLSAEFSPGTIVIELQPTTDVCIRFGAHADNSPGTADVYLRADNYYVYSVREFRKLGAMAANGAPDGDLIITELS